MSRQFRSKGPDPGKISSLGRLPAKALSSTRIQQSEREGEREGDREGERERER